jgi:hypothetical protein
MIDLHFSLTEPEYLQAQQLFTREQHRKLRWWLWAMSGIFLISATCVLLTTPKPITFAELPSSLPALFVIPIVLLCILPLQKHAFKKRFQKEKANLTNAHLILDARGYHCNVPGVGSGTAEWSGISSWLEGELVFVLRSGYLVRIVPKAALTEAQLNEVRTLLTEKIGPVSVSH